MSDVLPPPPSSPTPSAHERLYGSYNPVPDEITEKAKGAVRWIVWWVDIFSDMIAPRNKVEEMAPENIARGPILFGLWTILVVFGSFFLWSVLAPIDSAAIAIGKVVLDSNKKTISHLEGGIVKNILVVEGQSVEANQPLLVLDETKTKAQLDLYKTQYITARLAESRLMAERDGKDSVLFPPELVKLAKGSQTISTGIDNQKRLFESRKNAVEGQIAVLKQKIEQTRREIEGLNAQIRSSDRQINLLDEEIAVIEKLLEKGNAVRPRLLDRQRTRAQISGERGKNVALISRAEQNIGEAEISIINARNEFLNQVVAELKDTQDKISDLEERIRASADVMQRVVIRAPIAGYITGLEVHTVDGVIKPGETLMHIVPKDDELIIEARVSPRDIDVVRIGLEASVRLSAYRARYVPPVMGNVINVSADRFDDERTGEAYYIARIKILQEQLDKLSNVELTPGMPAEVLIKTGERTFLSYLLSPIGDSFNRAFREE